MNRRQTYRRRVEALERGEPVRVVLNDENSRAVRFLFQELRPRPGSMTAIVNAAVKHWVDQMAKRGDSYHAPFRELAEVPRRHLRVLS